MALALWQLNPIHKKGAIKSGFFLIRKKHLGRRSRSVAIFLKLDFFKMADFCSVLDLWSVKNQCYQIWTYYISLVRKFNAEHFLQKKCMLKVNIFKVI